MNVDIKLYTLNNILKENYDGVIRHNRSQQCAKMPFVLGRDRSKNKPLQLLWFNRIYSWRMLKNVDFKIFRKWYATSFVEVRWVHICSMRALQRRYNFQNGPYSDLPEQEIGLWKNNWWQKKFFYIAFCHRNDGNNWNCFVNWSDYWFEDW